MSAAAPATVAAAAAAASAPLVAKKPSMLPFQIISFIVKILGDKAGRSNFEKALQYGSRLIAARLKEQDPKNPWVAKFLAMSVLTSNSRKMGYLFQFLDQFELLKTVDWTNARSALNGLSYIGTGIFYALDNLVFLSKGKLLDEDADRVKISMCAFWFGQLFGLCGDMWDLQRSYKTEEKLSAQLLATKESAEVTNVEGQLKKLREDRFWLYNQIPVRGGNLVYSSNNWDLSTSVLGQPFSDEVVGWSGFISAAAAFYKVVAKMQ